MDLFRFDLNSSFFKRFIIEMNIASGCLFFISFVKFDDLSFAYVKEDIMFIKLVVDVLRG